MLVQAAPSVAETEFLLKVAHGSGGLVRGVVGWVDLTAPDAAATLDRLAHDPLLKSIRPMLQDVAAGRPMELDALLSAPCEIGRRLSIPTPNMDALLGLARLFARTHELYPAQGDACLST